MEAFPLKPSEIPKGWAKRTVYSFTTYYHWKYWSSTFFVEQETIRLTDWGGHKKSLKRQKRKSKDQTSGWSPLYLPTREGAYTLPLDVPASCTYYEWSKIRDVAANSKPPTQNITDKIEFWLCNKDWDWDSFMETEPGLNSPTAICELAETLAKFVVITTSSHC